MNLLNGVKLLSFIVAILYSYIVHALFKIRSVHGGDGFSSAGGTQTTSGRAAEQSRAHAHWPLPMRQASVPTTDFILKFE